MEPASEAAEGDHQCPSGTLAPAFTQSVSLPFPGDVYVLLVTRAQCLLSLRCMQFLAM